MAIPEPAVPFLVKALGAYMKTAPALDLPPGVRRLRHFHQKRLMAHSGEIVTMLEDEAVRGLVVQWLDDDGAALPEKQEQALRLAAARPEAWEDDLAALAGASRPAPAADPSDKLRAALRRESHRAAAAKEDVRRLKETARRSLEEERAAAKELRRELRAARRDAEASAGEAAQARTGSERLRADLDKVERRSRKEVAAAKAAQQDAAAQLRAVRKDLSAARRRIAELEESLDKAKRPKAARSREEKTPRGPRRRLRAPPGRLEDDPLTLDAWLDAPQVHLLVDGYNVTKSPEGFPDLDLPSQRDRLLEELEKLALRKGVPTTVVFDGSEVGPGTSRPGRRRVRVEYSRPGEIADDHLIAKLASLPPHPVVLVTSDRELQGRAAGEGATIATSAQLLELLR